jgi:hypothetical protein
MSLHAKLDIVAQVCDNLQRLHASGRAHGDVRPATVWLSADGAASLLEPDGTSQSRARPIQYGNVVGNAAYRAPEQLSGERIDGRADIFSVGVLLFELLSGRRPFHADGTTAVAMKVLHDPAPDIRTHVPDLPGGIALAVEKALQKEPARRYADAAGLASDLRRAMPARAVGRTDDHSLYDVTIPSRVNEPLDVDVDIDPVRRGIPGAAGASRPTLGAGAPRRRGAALLGSATVLALAAGVVWIVFRTAGQTGVRMEIRSIPPGAVISFDGAATRHRTPASVDLEAPPRRIGLTLEGYESLDAPVEQARGEPITLQYQLRRLVQIDSDPPGARVILDGRDTGQVTPATIPISDPPPAMELQLDGYEVAREGITRETIDAGKLFVRLAMNPPVETKSDAEVAEDPGQVTVNLSGTYRFAVSGCGTTSQTSRNHSVSVMPPCTLRLRAPEYFLDVMRTITVKMGPQLDLRAPPLARVQLRSRYENCLLLVGGKAIGSPPVDIEIAAGTYTATLECPDGKTMETTSFEIQAGNPVRRIDEYLR